MASSGLSLKLIIKKNTQEVIFAEANKQSMDFLIDSISIPEIHKAKKQKTFTAKETGKYIITADMKVKPFSSVSIIDLLNEFGVNNSGEFEERFVSLGMLERSMVEKASLEGKNVLTTLFLAK